MVDRFTVSPFESFVLHTRTRFPFRYGIASMTDVPHWFVRARVTLRGKSALGLAAEGLPPKWFTKNPLTTFEQDLPQMLAVIGHAAQAAQQIAHTPISFFDWWRELCRQQTDWADARRLAPLLAHLGVSLMERAVLDALSRLTAQPLHQLIAVNRLGVRLGEVCPPLGNTQPSDWLPPTPLNHCFARHTIGLGDSLTPENIPPAERVDDGLPQDLQSSIRAYGLRYFKVKLSGTPDRDFDRLQQLTRVLEHETGGEYFLTLDGNENFASFEMFREFWNQGRELPQLSNLWSHVLVVEQPVHRDRALADESGAALHRWSQRPPFIIDESDGALRDLPRALQLGYVGTSHKNCKGILKGLINACLLEKRRRAGQHGVLTGEDLCNLGPVALLQDLALMSLLGIEHVERNGHHYYRGLSMFPDTWQQLILENHSDLYQRHPHGFPTLHIHSGKLNLHSINAAPFGVEPLLDPTSFEPGSLPG